MKKELKAALAVLICVVIAWILAGMEGIKENRSAEAAVDTTAYISYADSTWTNQYWYDGRDYSPIKATTAKVTGEGQYTVGLDFTETGDGCASGLAYTDLEVSNGETEYAGYTIRIDSFKINGVKLTLGKGYTVSDNAKDTRYNIYNAWDTAKPEERIKDGARSWDGVITDASSTPAEDVLDSFEKVKTIEITFTYAKGVKQVVTPTEAPTEAPTVVPAEVYHAYLGFQTDAWDYRDAWEKDANSDLYDFDTQVMLDGQATNVNSVKVENAMITKNGTYSVSITGADLTKASKFNMLYISTDIPATMKNVKFSDIKVILDGIEYVTLPTGVIKKEVQEGSKKYYMAMAVNGYGVVGIDLPEAFKYNMPEKSMKLTFTVSGIKFSGDSELKTSSLSAKYTTVEKQNVQKAAVKLTWDQSKTADGYVVYRASGGKYQKLTTISKKSQNYYVDQNVVKGSTYAYKVRAYTIEEEGWVYGTYSSVKTIKVSTTILTPSVSYTKKGNTVTFTFKKVEGTNYESQYRYLGTKKWKTLSTLNGKISKKVTKKIKAKGFQIRIRTYMKISGKKVYSKYSKAMTIQ